MDLLKGSIILRTKKKKKNAIKGKLVILYICLD